MKNRKSNIIIKQVAKVSAPFAPVNISDPIDSSPLPAASAASAPKYKFVKLFEDIATKARSKPFSTCNTDNNDTLSETATYEEFEEFEEFEEYEEYEEYENIENITPYASPPFTPKISYSSSSVNISPLMK